MIKKEKIVLVVEDEVALQQAIKLKLEKEGIKAYTAQRVAEAIKILKKLKTVDVVWLDHYLLGKENGLDFVVKLKSVEEWKKIPIFVVSNTATHDKIDSYLKLGVHKYYTKSNLKLDSILKEIVGLKC
ncbi:MAG: response regulator [Bacteriovorax sp.]|nr:response regulator [Bacteriovorax sp.]